MLCLTSSGSKLVKLKHHSIPIPVYTVSPKSTSNVLNFFIILKANSGLKWTGRRILTNTFQIIEVPIEINVFLLPHIHTEHGVIIYLLHRTLWIRIDYSYSGTLKFITTEKKHTVYHWKLYCVIYGLEGFTSLVEVHAMEHHVKYKKVRVHETHYFTIRED